MQITDTMQPIQPTCKIQLSDMDTRGQQTMVKIETKTKLYLNKVFVLTRVKSDEESDGGGVDGNQADEDVG